MWGGLRAFSGPQYFLLPAPPSLWVALGKYVKNFPLWQKGLWHFSSLSEHSGFCLYVQIKYNLRASSKISLVCLHFDFSFLAAGVFWHRGQNHLLGTFVIFKQDKWNVEMGHAWFVPPVASLQKQAELGSGDDLWVYHLSRISGSTRYL